MSKEPPPPAADEAGRRYQSLLAITEAISSHQDISELFRDLPGQLRRAVDFDAVAVVLHDPARDVMRLHLFEARIPLAYPPPPEGPVDASPAGVVWRTQEPLLISPGAGETRFPQFVELLRAHDINTLYEAPLTSSGRRLGSIAFGSRRPHAYGEADLEFLRHVAKQVAVAGENALNFERATREGARAQLLLEINNAVVSHLDLEELVRTVSASLRDLLPHDAAGIALYEPELNQLREYTNVAYKDLDVFRVGEPIPLEGTPAGQVFLTGRPMLIRRPNPAAYPADRYSQRPVEGSPKSACLALLMSHGRKLGIAGVSSTQVERFTDEDLELFSQIAGQIAIAVENSLNFRNAARERDRRQLLLEVSNAVVSNLSLKELLLAVSGCLKQFFDHDYASIVLYDEEAGLLRVHALDALAPGGGHSEGSLLPIEGTPAGLAIKTRETILRERLDLNEFDAPETRLAYEAGLRSGCSVPLISHDRVLGAINVASLREAAFTEADAELLGQVAHQVAIALENALNFERARAAEQEVRRKLGRERLMLEINNAVVSQLSLRELVRVVSQCLREVLRPDVTAVSLYDPETNKFRAYMFDLPDNLPAIEEGTPMPLEGTVGGMAFTSGRPVFMSRPDPEVSSSEFDRRLIEGGIKSGGVVPLIAHDRKLGFLGVGSFREDAFSEADQELLCHTANQIAIAVENALNFERATKERERAETLLEVNNAIATNRNIRDLLRSTSACLRAYF